MLKLTKREMVILGIFIFMSILFASDKLYINKSEDIVVEHKSNKMEETEGNKENENEKEEKLIMVDICGEVKRSGIVKLKEGARLVEAVNIAGGLLDTADRKQVNMAKVLLDGEQIVIPKIGQDQWNDENPKTYKIHKNSNQVNINTASESELQSLNGVGKVLAERIIEYREKKGRFKHISDIKKVPGVGDKKYEMLKEQIRVN
ncbi:helix-hairpin-helix domain-containing protein [Crassaminicella indica]|uniref:Helix-hairpin-helix domain-containing protein n=1 Tax=Crassaminicella indica TaxID=2855394 RepID=A0ABX8RG48_9CLOT|nr:helix-hairpin-helix domain-containing protein [Crassaminicella indica]QXM05916.1 helix-hairpin-helix domain-containing protein [Crassaminicella indica]